MSATLTGVTPQHLATLIFLSYRFSQGGIGTQNRMLLFIERHYHPELFCGPHLVEVKRLTRGMVAPYFLNERTHPATAVPWEEASPETFVKTERLVTNELASLFERFADRSQMSTFDSDPAALAESVIVMDDDYLKRPGGRAGGSEALKVKVGPYRRDPFGSVFVEHGLLSQPTGTPEFDAMFAAIGDPSVLGRFDPHALRRLRGVIEIYRTEHPGLDDNRLEACDAHCAALMHGK